MRLSYLLLCGGLMLAACADTRNLPPDVLPVEAMEQVLWDMIRADRFNSSFIFTRRDSALRATNEEEAAIMFEKVFAVHGISREDFLHSYKYYLSRPDLLKGIVDTLISRGDRMRAKMYEEELPGGTGTADTLNHKK